MHTWWATATALPTPLHKPLPKSRIQVQPAFIYGGVGLGKTHLLHDWERAGRERAQCALLHLEQFTNDLISAIRSQTTEQFRNKYAAELDVLLIDDIQFIAGKESTQRRRYSTPSTTSRPPASRWS